MQPILKVNLSNNSKDLFQVPKSWEEQYLGGASLAARLLYDCLTINLEPLSPEAPLLFLTGPLTGTSGPAVGRFVICGRSPSTKLWGESNCGGFWGTELRNAGFDGIWIEGSSRKPVYLWLNDSNLEFMDAAHLWGLETYQTQFQIENEIKVKNIRIATIGPGGEACIPYASILCDHGRVAARTGLGAVMGSKNLKAIAVKGSGKPPIYDQKRFSTLRSTLNQDLRNNSSSIVLRELGTSSATEFFDYLSEQPKKYFQRSSFDDDHNVTGTRMKETILTGVSACHACVIACGRIVESDHNNEIPMRKRKGPEYETMMGFGPNLWINDLDFTVRMGEICDRFGLDSISLSNTIGLAYHLYEIGAITKKDTDDVELEWGNTLAVETLISLTIQGKGIGAVMAKGAKELARNFGYPEEAVQVNGLEAPFHDPRGVTGMALVYATSPRGACHNQSDYFMADIGQVEKSLDMKNFSRLDGYEKTTNVIIHQNWRSVFNSLVLCFFANLPPESVVEMVNSITGLNLNLEDLLEIGNRAWTLKRVINFRLGLTKNNDKLPKSFMIPFHDDMEMSNSTVPDFKQMLEHYYRLRKWDQESGFPSSELLQDLNLDWVSD